MGLSIGIMLTVICSWKLKIMPINCVQIDGIVLRGPSATGFQYGLYTLSGIWVANFITRRLGFNVLSHLGEYPGYAFTPMLLSYFGAVTWNDVIEQDIQMTMTNIFVFYEMFQMISEHARINKEYSSIDLNKTKSSEEGELFTLIKSLEGIENGEACKLKEESIKEN